MKVQNLSLLLILFSFLSCQNHHISFENDYFEISINQEGYVESLVDAQSEIDYINENVQSALIQLRRDTLLFEPQSFEPTDKEGQYLVSFTSLSSNLILGIEAHDSYIRFEILDFNNTDDIDVAVWGPFENTIDKTIGEIIGVVRNNDFALGIQSLNIRTLGGFPSMENDTDKAYDIFETNSIVDVSDSVKVLYRGQTAIKTKSGSKIQAYVRDRSKSRIIPNWNHIKYEAPAFNDEGIKGSAIALFGCPPDIALETIGIIELEEGLSHPIIDGKWGKTQRSATASYLIMNFGEDNLDEAMKLTHLAGLKYLYHGGPFINWGHFDLNKKEFPDNWESMKRCVTRANAEGLRLGLHTLSNFITTNDPYVTPIPDSRLAIVGSSNLSADISSNDIEIGIKNPDFFNQMKNNTLHAVMLNNEIIRYREVSKDAPWKLLDCERGAFGTKNIAHNNGDKISKLMDHAYKTFLTNAELSKEMALTLADLFNQTGLKQISFDGLEGNWSTGMGQYGRQLFTQYWYDALNPELKGTVITDASNPGHFFWHMYTRMNWGEPWYAGFRESQTQYRLLNQAFYQRNLMPSMLGWFRMTAEISMEDIEWLLARSAGFDAGFALLTSNAIVSAHGQGEKIMKTIKMWEEARMAGVFPEDIKVDMQNINREFHLEQVRSGSWNLYTAILEKGIYKNMPKQPGEPNLLTIDLKNENPEQTLSFILSAPKESGLSQIQLEIDNYRKILLPVDLPAEHHIKYTGGSYVTLYDAQWHVIETGRVIQDHLTVGQGEHSIVIEGLFTGSEGDIKVEFRTLSPATLIK